MARLTAFRAPQVTLGECERYDRYRAYCEILEVQPLEFAGWRRESAKIPEIRVSFDYHLNGIGNPYL